MHHKTAESHARGEAPQTAGRTIRSWARFYDAASWLLSLGRASGIRKMIAEMAAAAPGEAVLDVGCGTGSLAIALKAEVGESGEVRGIDASPEMIERARRKAAKQGAAVEFVVAPIEELRFPEARFDLVVSSFMLHHLPDDVKRKGLAPVMAEAGFTEVETGVTKYRSVAYLRGKAG